MYAIQCVQSDAYRHILQWPASLPHSELLDQSLWERLLSPSAWHMLWLLLGVWHATLKVNDTFQSKLLVPAQNRAKCRSKKKNKKMTPTAENFEQFIFSSQNIFGTPLTWLCLTPVNSYLENNAQRAPHFCASELLEQHLHCHRHKSRPDAHSLRLRCEFDFQNLVKCFKWVR